MRYKSTCPIYIRKRFFKLLRNSSEICLDDPRVPCDWAQAAEAWWPLAFCILSPASPRQPPYEAKVMMSPLLGFIAT